ncbi:hypothetical protein [Streptomyces bluensis]|uniref:hypothetical protein n=1 Tax=Streptomyces bluensis TaxID=33897 RepID=UPI00332813B7
MTFANAGITGCHGALVQKLCSQAAKSRPLRSVPPVTRTSACDALKFPTAHARFLREEKQAHELPVVKVDLEALFAVLRALPRLVTTVRLYERRGRTRVGPADLTACR